MKIQILFISLSISCLWSCTSSTINENNSVPKEERTLYLIRHSKVDDKDSLATDFEKHISKEGKEDAKLIGDKMLQRGIVLDKMLSSSAKRAESTSKRFAITLNFGEENVEHDTILYKARTQDLIDVIRNLDPKFKSVAIVGHNPSMIQAANHFQKDTIFMEIPTSGVVAIQFNSNSWQYLGHKDGKFLFFEYPKLYDVK